MELSAPQYKLLKRLHKAKRIELSSFSDSEKADISFLANNGLIHYEAIYDENDARKVNRTDVVIQPRGQAEYDTYVRVRRRWFIPLVISLVSTAISLAALYKASQPIYIQIDTNTMNAVTAANAPAKQEE